MNPISNFGLRELIYVGLFLGVLMIFEGLRQLLSRGEDRSTARNRRMRLIAGGATTETVLDLLKPNTNQKGFAGLPFLRDLPMTLHRADVRIKPLQFVGLCLVATLTIGAALSRTLNPAIAVAVAVVVGCILPALVIRSMASRRITKLVTQLPDALDLMARGLRVGHPLNATIASVARDMADPIASEFGVLVDQVSYGDTIVDAFADLADRVANDDVRYLSTSVAIQNGTGGDLAHILVTLSKVIRARIVMRKRIQAISSEGRLTANFLSFLPVAIFGFTSMSSPTYYMGVSDDPLFRPLAITVIVLTVGNYLAMKKLVNFRI